MTPPCRFCRIDAAGGRRPCAEGADRCGKCLERVPALARRQLEQQLDALGLASHAAAARDRLTVNVERSKSGSIGAATVGCGGPPKEDEKP